MKKLLFICMIFSACNNLKDKPIDQQHIEVLAKEFMQNTVIPKMKDPKPYEVTGGKVVVKRASDVIDDYKFTYDHLSLSDFDSMNNKRRLDSLISVTRDPDSIISVTVNVGYKTKYQFGDIRTDSIKLRYDVKKDQITYWPF